MFYYVVVMLKILHIICGSIAAYKGLEIIRLLKDKNSEVTAILTQGGAKFITPLSCSTLSETPTHSDLFPTDHDAKMWHINLARTNDVILIAPASANLIAKMAHGLADTLASTVLLTTTTPIYVAPAMNVEMWNHPATQKNITILKERGVTFIGPDEGVLACNEQGLGKMSSPEEIVRFLFSELNQNLPLAKMRVLITAGPTRETIDPVRFLSNHSSGKQGYAIAEALIRLGANVTLISGPTSLIPPKGLKKFSPITTADEMLKCAEDSLPCEIAICTAAVVDWKIEKPFSQKLKKSNNPPSFQFVPTPDILKTLSCHKQRPPLLIGFAAETENVIENAITKHQLKNIDWILANDVSQNVFGSDENTVHFIDNHHQENWPKLSKKDIATKLAQKIITFMNKGTNA